MNEKVTSTLLNNHHPTLSILKGHVWRRSGGDKKLMKLVLQHFKL